MDAPELDVRIEPSLIQKGESALLTWDSRNSSRVYINPNIGFVDAAGRIKFFPEETTTYTVTAEGPGGETSRSVTVEVREQDASIDQSNLLPDLVAGTFEEGVRPVFFDFDSASLSEQARVTLDANARWLGHPDHENIQFVIEGHADARGSEEYNFALGDKRAETVREYLISRGVDPGRMVTVSMGEEQPFASGNSERDHALNRRVQFVVLRQLP